MWKKLFKPKPVKTVACLVFDKKYFHFWLEKFKKPGHEYIPINRLEDIMGKRFHSMECLPGWTSIPDAGTLFNNIEARIIK
jgi:hypothetical protein